MPNPDKPIVTAIREAVLNTRSNDPNQVTDAVVYALRPIMVDMSMQIGSIIINGDLDDEGIREDLTALLDRWENYL